MFPLQILANRKQALLSSLAESGLVVLEKPIFKSVITLRASLGLVDKFIQPVRAFWKTEKFRYISF